MPGKLSFASDKIRSISEPQLDAKKVKASSSSSSPPSYERVGTGDDMSEADVKGNWFNTWPERHYDKLENQCGGETPSPDEESDPSRPEAERTAAAQVPLDSILDKIAYSPVTKQLLLVTDERRDAIREQDTSGNNGKNNDDTDEVEEEDDFDQFRSASPATNDEGELPPDDKTKAPDLVLELSHNLGKDLVLRSCLKRLELTAEEKFTYLWNSKIGYADPRRQVDSSQPDALKSDPLRTEASSFSSIVSSLSDGSPSNLDDASSGRIGLFDGDGVSVRSHDSGSNYGESSKFFDERPTAAGKVEAKRKGLSGFFSRNVFSWKGASSSSSTSASTSQVWKLFGGRSSAPEASNSAEANLCTDSPRASERSLTDSPVSGKKYEDVVASSSALILHNRPANLPAKSIDEEQKHRLEYQQMVEAAKKKEMKETKLRKKQLQEQLKLEEQLSNATRIWMKEILPKWDTMKNSRKARDLWWSGLPPCVRGRIWKLAIGNDLNITNQLYEICVARAQERLKAAATDATSSADSKGDTADKESSVELIQLDIARTFPHLCIFQKGGPYYDVLHSLVGAYVCYRPDVGYVQGMSYIAAVLILNLDTVDAFISFANLLNRPCHMAFFSLNERMMEAYYDTFADFFRENLPRLYQHFAESSLTTDLYLLDWVYSVFAKAMPLDVVCRVWDVYLRDGEEFLFRTALGILHLHREKLMTLDFVYASQFLTKLPDDLNGDELFKSIDSIKMSVGKQKFAQVLSGHVERHSAS